MRTHIKAVAHALAVAALAALAPLPSAMGHHSAAVYFDTATTIEVRGVIGEVKWQNPHIGFTLISRDAAGDETIWAIESNSVSTLRQLGITADQLGVGDVVTVAGWPAKQRADGMSGNHVLLPDGSELVLRGAGARHFLEGTDDRLVVADIDARELGDAGALGIFRVWSSVTGDANQDRLWAASYPLTEAARAAQAAWDPVRDNPAVRCEPKGMPAIVDPPYPMEIIDRGDVIIIRQEEFDTVRTIYMNPEVAPADPAPSLLGHSLGHWEGDTLVVETSQVNWPYFDNQGIPQTEQARFAERFTVSLNGKRLNYTIDVTDPATFTEPVRLDRFWLWMLDNQVEPYDCIPL